MKEYTQMGGTTSFTTDLLQTISTWDESLRQQLITVVQDTTYQIANETLAEGGEITYSDRLVSDPDHVLYIRLRDFMPSIEGLEPPPFDIAVGVSWLEDTDDTRVFDIAIFAGTKQEIDIFFYETQVGYFDHPATRILQ